MLEENLSLTNQNVYFDGTFLDNRSGVGRDSRNFLRAANLAYGGSVKVIYPRLRVFSRVVKNSSKPSNSKFQKLLKFRYILIQKAEICQLEEQSVFIQSHLHCVAPAIGGHLKHIVRLHDVFPISNPEWFRRYSRVIFSIGFYNAISRAVFICDSQTTQNELQKNIMPEKASSVVALCPVEVPSGLLCESCSGCKTLALTQKHIISVSTLEPRKNYSELIFAWVNSMVFVQNNIELYIVGRQGWKSSKLTRNLRQNGSLWGIRWIEDACDESVQGLLRSSEFLVSTSIEEGFNLSVAEALLQGVPVLISNNQVHTEIYSSNATFYELFDPADLSKEIKELLSNRNTCSTGVSHALHFADYDGALKTLANAIRDA
jgi:glycosyltransferase involved in cell wall biosynthesis